MADVRNRVYVELIATGTRDVEQATSKAADSVREVGQAAKSTGAEVAKSESAVSGLASAMSSGLARGAAGAADAFGKLEGAIGAALKPLGLIGAVIGGVEAAIALYERAVAALDDEIKTGTGDVNFLAAALDGVKLAHERAKTAAEEYSTVLQKQQDVLSQAAGGVVEATLLDPRLLGQALKAAYDLEAAQKDLALANLEVAKTADAGNEELAHAAQVAQSEALSRVLTSERLLRDIKRTRAEAPKAAAAAPPVQAWSALVDQIEAARVAREASQADVLGLAADEAAAQAAAARQAEAAEMIRAVDEGVSLAQQAVDDLTASMPELEAAIQAAMDQQVIMDFADGIATGAAAAKTAIGAWSGALKQLGAGVRTISFFEGLQATADAADAVADSIKAFAAGNPISGAGFVAAAAAYAVSAGAYFKAAGKGGGGGSTAAAAGAGAGASGASAQPRSGDFGGRTQQGPTVVNVNNFDGTFFATEDAALRGLGEAAMKGMNDRARGARRLRTDVVDSQPVATGRR